MSDSGGDIVAYDYATHDWWVDYSVHEEGNVVLRVSGDVVYCPGLDYLGDEVWEWGNLYYNEGAGWVRKETVPVALHVHDVAVHDGRLWVTTGNGPPDYAGKLFSSGDMGDNWVEEFAVYPQPPENFYRRLYGLHVHDGSLFAQSDFWLPEGPALFEFRPGGEMITHLLPEADYCLAEFTEFQGKLLCLTRTLLDVYDGVAWSGLPVVHPSYNFASRALAVHRERVYVGGREGAAWTDDLANWTPISVADFAGKGVESYGVFHGRLYAGTVGAGEVYVTPAASRGELVSEPHGFPGPFCAGNLDWDAILPPGTDVALQFRSAANVERLADAVWRGPDGSPDSFYSESGTPLASVHCGDTWAQYRVLLTSPDEALSSVVSEVRVEVESASDALHVWPSPSRGTVHLALPETAPVLRVLVFDIRGRLVRTLDPAGEHALDWDGRDNAGRLLPAGIYLIAAELHTGLAPARRVVLLH